MWHICCWPGHSERLLLPVPFPSWIIRCTFLKRKTPHNNLNTIFNSFYFPRISTSLHLLGNHLLPRETPKQSVHGSTVALVLALQRAGADLRTGSCYSKSLCPLFLQRQRARRNSRGQVSGSPFWSIGRSLRGASQDLWNRWGRNVNYWKEVFEALWCWASSAPGFSQTECGTRKGKKIMQAIAVQVVCRAYAFSLKVSPLSSNAAELLF